MANEHPKLINDELPTLWDLFSPLYYFAKGVYDGVQDSKAKAKQYVQASILDFERRRLEDLKYASVFMDYYQKFDASIERPKIEKPKVKRRLPKVSLAYKEYCCD